jgi:type 1 fimbria pilin
MHSARNCHKALTGAALLAAAALTGTPAQAITLNFSAMLTSGTCTFDLDKSTLFLGHVSTTQMKPTTLLATQPFTLRVTRCIGADPTLTPVVSVTGTGMDQGGKWVFRENSSVATGAGVMLVKTSTPPDYSAAETKDGDTFPLAPTGTVPGDQSHTFFAGLTCGSAATCGRTTVGTLTARIVFSLDYR